MPEYELEVETEMSVICDSFPHTREGYTLALEKIDRLRKMCKIMSARINSSRDGIIYNF
jgi:hypothetical protein